MHNMDTYCIFVKGHSNYLEKRYQFIDYRIISLKVFGLVYNVQVILYTNNRSIEGELVFFLFWKKEVKYHVKFYWNCNYKMSNECKVNNDVSWYPISDLYFNTMKFKLKKCGLNPMSPLISHSLLYQDLGCFRQQYAQWCYRYFDVSNWHCNRCNLTLLWLILNLLCRSHDVYLAIVVKRQQRSIKTLTSRIGVET